MVNELKFEIKNAKELKKKPTEWEIERRRNTHSQWEMTNTQIYLTVATYTNDWKVEKRKPKNKKKKHQNSLELWTISKWWLTSSLASSTVFFSSNDITNKNMNMHVGSTLNCSVIAFDSAVRKPDPGQILAAVRTQTYINGPIIVAPYKLNLWRAFIFEWKREREREKFIDFIANQKWFHTKSMKLNSSGRTAVFMCVCVRIQDIAIKTSPTSYTFSSRMFANSVFPPTFVPPTNRPAKVLHTTPYHEGFYIRWKCEPIF